MIYGRQFGMMGGAALALSVVVLSPALAANGDKAGKPRVSLSARGGIGSFTPASGDARIASIIARSNLNASGLRFTPSASSVRLNRSVTVAVRARSGTGRAPSERVALVDPTPGTQIAPVAYNLGAAVGWKRFAISGDVAKVDSVIGGREAVDLGLSYNTRRWSARVAAGADRATPTTPRGLADAPAYSLDVGGAYSLSRRVDVTAGVRYRASERDRLQSVTDSRRDSQAVYVGTAVKF